MLTAQIPMAHVGPIKIRSEEVNAALKVPLATFESPLWPSVDRGAKISRLCDGIQVVILDDKMTRSILLEATSVVQAKQAMTRLNEDKDKLSALTQETSQFAKFIDYNIQVVGQLIYIRFEFSCGDAAGHNMVTKASQRLLEWILEQQPILKYVSLSGNYCTDKKVSAVNGILGRGKYVVSELVVPRSICQQYLHTTPQQIVDLNIKKNLIGSIVSGSVRSANAHFANMLMAIYLATGQDAANIVEGSQGIVHTALNDAGDLYFSVTIPNIIIGTVGNGKQLEFVQANLAMLGCSAEQGAGQNSRRLAIITAAVVLCGELSLLAALTDPSELMRAHVKIERQKRCPHYQA